MASETRSIPFSIDNILRPDNPDITVEQPHSTSRALTLAERLAGTTFNINNLAIKEHKIDRKTL